MPIDWYRAGSINALVRLTKNFDWYRAGLIDIALVRLTKNWPRALSMKTSWKRVKEQIQRLFLLWWFYSTPSAATTAKEKRTLKFQLPTPSTTISGNCFHSTDKSGKRGFDQWTMDTQVRSWTINLLVFFMHCFLFEHNHSKFQSNLISVFYRYFAYF